MLNEGYVRLFRSITSWEWYDDIPTFRLFTHLLLTCNWQEKKWHGHLIKPGQRVVSLKKLSEETGLSLQAVRTAISHMESTGEVTRFQHGKIGVVAIKNWDKFQEGNTIPNTNINTKATRNQHGTNTELTPIEESKKAIKQESKKNPIVPRDFDDLCGICVTDNARAAQKEVASWLKGRGYSCTLEVPVADRGDGRTGRIDLVAERDDIRVAIEIDRESPREKSLFKLRQFDCAKVVIVRDGALKGTRTTQDGIKICYLSCKKYDGFDQFWAAYPKKRSKGAARKAWDKLHVDSTMQATILQAIERAKQSEDWQKDGGQYIPYPATWLNAEGWEDEEPGPEPPPDRPPVKMHWVVPNPDSDNWEDLVP